MPVKSYRELVAWQKAIQLTTLVYRATKPFPQDERFGLTQQLRRSAVSVPSNIAEGQGRATTKDFLHFLSVAQGSLNELETQLILSRELDYLAEGPLAQLLACCAEVGRIMHGLRNSLTPPPDEAPC
jgi:four helix bundle protein